MVVIPLISMIHAILRILLSALNTEHTPRSPVLTRIKAVRLSAQRALVPSDPICDIRGREDKFCLRRELGRQPQAFCSAVRPTEANTSSSTSTTPNSDEETSSRGEPTCSKDQPPHCDSLFLDAGVRLVRDEDCLNGPQRLVADGFLTQEECETLLKLSESATVGSGYEEVFPMTHYEVFSGITATDLEERLKKSSIDVSAAKLMLLASDKTRLYVEAYFRLKRRLYIHFLHLACRNATENSTTKRTDMSHRIHSDNCQFQDDSSCPVLRQNIACRDFSAVIYLNDVHGGEMVLATAPRTSIRAAIPPKCGRMVALNSRNPHGVLPVFSGRRCALLTWMTYESGEQDSALPDCWRMMGYVDGDGYYRNASQYQ
ncbi:prolyl 3-hydroxylase 3-like [Dermacentor albipictus]|uniref:prolyl 3-hydroxylase 3-like n=1 Tax=Dermacentor albipictus TaxID=60249 RepID=UPI0038FC41E9